MGINLNLEQNPREDTVVGYLDFSQELDVVASEKNEGADENILIEIWKEVYRQNETAYQPKELKLVIIGNVRSDQQQKRLNRV